MSEPIAEAAGAPALRRVHVVFKTHLDVGYTDLASDVVADYLDHHIPRALALAAELRRAGDDRFIWTTGSWLIAEYLDRATPADRARLVRAIVEGDIAWHALPFTMHGELLDADLFRVGLGLARDLDRRFGRTTIAAKMTDVPGVTRGVVPLLAEAGVRFLHVGVNPASRPPSVPPVFVWRDPHGAEVVVAYSFGSYGDLVRAPGHDEALLFAHTNDNLGPQSAKDVRRIFRSARRRFPGAEVVASTLDAFAEGLLAVKDRLPVVSQEIGDTWIHGVGSDPTKVGGYRELLRRRWGWIASGRAAPDSPEVRAFSRRLLLVPEHTWGLDEKTHLADRASYDAASLAAAREAPSFRKMEASWAEQRAYVADAVAALGDSDLGREAAAALAALRPARPDPTDLVAVDPTSRFETRHFHLGFDPTTGALTTLRQNGQRRKWASERHPLALFGYQTFEQSDYDRFYRQYVVNKRRVAGWAVDDFTKPGIDAAGARGGFSRPRLTSLRRAESEVGHRFLLDLAPDGDPSDLDGCPRSLSLEVEAPNDEPILQFTLQWFDKPATRLPEALWLSFAPRVRESAGWRLEKLGQEVSPLDVVRGGGRHLHAIDAGVSYRDAAGSLLVESLDAPLVAPGAPSLLDFTNRRPPLRKGMHFLLYDNLWGTNFPMWFGEDARFRFVVRIAAAEAVETGEALDAEPENGEEPTTAD